MKQIRKRLTYANVMSSIAVFLVLGGGAAYAAKKIGSNEIKGNSITTGKIKKEAVTKGKIKKSAIDSSRLADNAVTTSKIANDAVTGDKVKESTLSEVPSAAFAKAAGTANNVFTALIDSSGSVIRSLPTGITAIHISTGLYEVDFHRPIANCNWFTALGGDDFVPQLGEVSAVPRAGNANALFVSRANSAGTLTDGDFYAELYC